MCRLVILLGMCWGLNVMQIDAQQLSSYNAMTPMPTNLELLNDTDGNTISVMQLGSDLYAMQVFNYQDEQWSFGINSRLEEDLPYGNTNYDYQGFYYLDIGCNFVINAFSLCLNIENFVNIGNQEFSIDPIRATADGVVNHIQFSQEMDALISFKIAYNF